MIGVEEGKEEGWFLAMRVLEIPAGGRGFLLVRLIRLLMIDLQMNSSIKRGKNEEQIQLS